MERYVVKRAELPEIGDFVSINHLGRVYHDQEVVKFIVVVKDDETGQTWLAGPEDILQEGESDV